MHGTTELPVPTPAEQQLSDALVSAIRAEIAAAGGAIPFSRYMEMCLYTPGLGYYSAGQRKFGAGGDFVTAPEISPLFGRCVARSCAAVLEATGGSLLEFGAGSGRLAADLLGELAVLDCLPDSYLILERSAELRQRQQHTLQRELPQLADRVSWLDTLPGPGYRGVVLANEVLDAMACERWRWNGERVEQYFVVPDGPGFAWQARTCAGSELATTIEGYARQYGLDRGYISEVNPAITPWLRSIAECLEAGLVLLIDYGYPRREYLHPQRANGTLQCHYRQRVHDDVFYCPGLQDITAHVDFTAVAEAATAADLQVAGYTTQAHFLLDCGLDRLLQSAGPADEVGYLQQAQQAKTLILPGEMGERFHCIGLTRGLDAEIPGFRMHDMRGRL
ncbi:MAG: SAM-dependent methyltransferase [Halobacteria archaeon]|nr:SAM-dependent methyltransferase [Halobacteria archaeon]